MRNRLLLVALFFLTVNRASAQGVTCLATAVPPIVRAEGLSERLGDIVLNCTGGTPGGFLTGNLTVFLNVNVSNRITPANNLDVVLTSDAGAGPTLVTAPGILLGPSAVAFNGLNVPLSPAGAVVLRLTNLRGAVGAASVVPQTVIATLAFNGGTLVNFTVNNFTVGVPLAGLLASSSSTAVVCVGSSLPDTIDLPNLFAQGTRFFSTRVTEGSPEAFERRQPMTDAGVRVMLRYTGFPGSARLFVPDVIAGSSAVQQTAAGDLGVPQSGGAYQATGNGSLLLVRVRNTDASGAGGTLSFVPAGSPIATLTAASEVELSAGAGVAVFEVVDADRTVIESAQIPTFLGLPPVTGGDAVVAMARVSLAPLSTVGAASSSAPIPRFRDVPPPVDCATLRDCNANYFPELVVDSPSLQFTARTGSAFQVRYIRVLNEGGSLLNWTANVSYKNGADWIRIDPASGLSNGTLRLDVLPEKLAPGIYEAVLTIDAGPFAGSRSAPVRLEVTEAQVQPPPPQPQVTIRNVTNGANFREGALVAGSLASIFGSRLTGRDVQVTFEGLPARLLYISEGQINLEVPVGVAGQSTALVMVTVDGVRSTPRIVQLAASAPAIFGVLNEDSSLNSASNPALVGSTIQVFATGVTSPGVTRITARIHDREIEMPSYAGDAPGLTAVQQVNIVVPADLPAMSTEVRVCGAPALNPAQRTCGWPLLMHIRR